MDGNGGNISCRLGRNYVLCTPTMMSKGDMEPADICLSDMDGNIVAGDRLRTSELLLHLEIYRANPRARAVVHCHPPYATAFSLTGTPPPVGLISEYEIFIGPAALARYETPGTHAFAETVLPFVQQHNTILLSNHGVVCWSDTVTHAEWLTEILESYCKTCVIAKQIGKPLVHIPEKKIEEILALKRKLGLPDARMEPLPAPDALSAPVNPELEKLVRKVVSRLEERPVRSGQLDWAHSDTKGRNKAKPCYTGFALSDLDVSGGLPLLIKAIQPGTDFPQAPTA